MISLESLGREPGSDEVFRRAPTHLWQPDNCGEVDIRIDAQGQWWHEGKPIRRAGLLRLLASVLIYEEGSYWLKTPVEKMRIEVEDAPFVVQELTPRDGGLEGVTNVGELVCLETPWRLHPDPGGEARPWVKLTESIGARLSRNLYYHLVNEAAAQPDSERDGVLVWQAGGKAWPLGYL